MPAPIQLLFDLGLSDLNPIEVGEGFNPPDHTIKPKSFNGVIIHHIRKGFGTLYVRDKRYRVGPDQAFIINPGQERFIHYTSDHDDPWEYTWLSFTGKLAPHFSLLPAVFDVPKNSFPHTYGLKNAGENIGHLLAADLFALYAAIVEPLLHAPDIASDVTAYLEQHYMQKLSIQDLASHFCIDRRELSRRFKEHTGLSIRACLTKIRMVHAEELLRQGSNIKEIVELCGFSSVSNFYQMFSDHQGMTPTAWMKLQDQ
ncbi:MAG: AraC family transcriptional regulator [Oscillospiraceae bacterium]|nr:AraC family transcriptional regulator [Oscillospiraceae bacterium]